ncbi:RNA-binding protein 6 isoform X1 [Ochotona curzoniae]|uniref:RNA-binding protein 6 isoform X1 n=2 Tax=Ochotona curzoniae TaxID=130825 RepID=UPI001B352EAE|nr:RNA-binding protein 6 isoform X1 [Ochotona curzoniae]XP_040850437.1 RNA-binding protein 6 isoform X1 [Ochotona curzoniae]
MWGDSRPTNRTGPFRGSQEERFAPGWNRDYPPPLKSHAQERHSGNCPGRDSLPFDFQGHSGPPFANVEEHSFSYGARDGPHGDYRGGEGPGHDFRGGDFSSSDFQSRDSSQLDFRGRDMHSGDFRDREGPPMDYRGGDGTSMDYRGREPPHMNYRDRDAHAVDFRGRNPPPSEFRARGTYDLDFRGRDGTHADFRGRDLSDLDFRPRDQSRSDFRNREVSDLDFRDKDGTQMDFRGRGSGTTDLDFRDRDTPHSDFRGRHRSRSDQDFRGREVGPCMEFKDRERPLGDPNVLDYIQPSTQDRENSGMNVNKREESTHDHTVERPTFGIQKGEFEHSETREGETQGVAFERESPSDFQNSQTPVQDQEKSQLSGGEQQNSDAGLFKEEGGLDFLGRQDTDYRSMEYRDVDHRLPGNQMFSYGQSKSFLEGRTARDAQRDLQDQDYRMGSSEQKPSKLIRLSGVPENATKEEILNAFRSPDGKPVKELQLKQCNTGYDYGYVCVEFSLLEDAIGCMEANQGSLMIRDKEVTLEYVPGPDFWYCKRCKSNTGGHRSSCSFCKCPKEEAKQVLITYPQPQKISIPTPSEKQSNQASRTADKEPESRKREEGQESRLGHQKRDSERYPPHSRRDGPTFRRDREKEPWPGDGRQDGESKTIMLKRIYRSTPPEVIVEVLEPYVRLTTANVRIIKNRTGPMGHTYGFIDLDSHAEALRVVKILQNLDPPFSIDGKMVAVNLATGKRRNDSGDHSDHMHYYQGKKYFRDRRGNSRNSDWSSDTNRQGQQSSSDCYIYDSATGYYYDPLAGTYYDPTTQQEVYVPQDPGSPEEEEVKEKKPTSQGKSSSKKETPKKDCKEKKDKAVPRFQENATEGKPPTEDVFKKPLPPTVKKEESPPPPKVVNPLIGLLGEYGGDSDYEEEEEEEQAPPQQPRTMQPQQREEQTKKESEEDKLTDWNKLACLLCRRQFPNKEVLLKHQQLSDLHKQNLEIHRKIKQSEQELAYLERREREGKYKERGNDRREKLQSFDSPERKRIKYSKETDSDRKPVDKEDSDSGKGGCVQQATGWRKGAGLGYGHPGLATSEEQTEGRMKGPGVGTPGRPSKRQSNETYRDAVRRVMFARYKELD